MASLATCMVAFVKDVEKYFAHSGKPASDIRPINTPSVEDHQFPPKDFASMGALSNDAVRIVMKAFYGARFVNRQSGASNFVVVYCR